MKLFSKKEIKAINSTVWAISIMALWLIVFFFAAYFLTPIAFEKATPGSVKMPVSVIVFLSFAYSAATVIILLITRRIKLFK